MSDLVAARMTMGLSLGFHIVLAVIGMVMPFFMVVAHRRWLKTGEDAAYRLTRSWMRGVAIFFAVGAVSGTALSFELGLLWPGFMKHAGPIIGIPFSLEGAAFFVEAIALGIYMYGWQKLPPRLHWLSGLAVGIAGVASGILVVSANAWMNAPVGFDWDGSAASNIDPWRALLNPAWASQGTHMFFAAFEAVGFAVAGVHLYLWRRTAATDKSNQGFHRLAVRISLGFAIVAALLQPLSGHWSAQDVAERQPAKLAAMEAHFQTETSAPLFLGGIVDEEKEEVSWALRIPGGLSFLAFDDFDAEVVGLDAFAKQDRPPVAIVHYSFQVMVGIGSLLALLACLSLFALWRREMWLASGWLGRALVLATPLGFVAIEAGWMVTELGRQPWIVYGIMRTEDALTPVPGQIIHLLTFASLYGLLAISTAWMWSKQLRAARTALSPSAQLREWAQVPAPAEKEADNE